MLSTTRRWRASVAVAAGALALAGCASNDGVGSPGATTVTIKPTSYVTLAPAITTTTLAALPEAGETVESEQSYTVVFGDYLYGIAEKFGVEASEIASYNEWPEGINHPLNPGDLVRIPPGGKAPGPTEGEGEPTTADPQSGEGSTPEAASTTTTAPAGACPPGEYTITAEDTSRLKVANKFDITVEELDAANVGTEGYSAFYPGLKIVIPNKNC
jgi:LysM repeat protein